MGVFHHSVELTAIEGGIARYRFFPNFISHPECVGEFSVNTSTWSVQILTESPAIGLAFNRSADDVVLCLVHKIRRACAESGGVVPQRVSHIA